MISVNVAIDPDKAVVASIALLTAEFVKEQDFKQIGVLQGRMPVENIDQLRLAEGIVSVEIDGNLRRAKPVTG